MEERGTKISETRVEQILETKADIVASACPYCLQMFGDAIKAKEEAIKTGMFRVPIDEAQPEAVN